MDVAAAMRLHAAHVAQDRVWLGLFDFVAWAAEAGVRVYVLFGDSQVDVLHLFHPTAAAELPMPARPPYHVVASRIDEGLVLAVDTVLTADVNSMNHWLAASVIAPSDAGDVAAPGDGGLGPETVGAGASVVADPTLMSMRLANSDHTFLQTYYRTMGFYVHVTAAQGDCGVDAACILEGGPRGYVAWKTWRSRVSRFILARSEDEGWQSCFKACQEMELGPPPPLDDSDASEDGADAEDGAGSASRAGRLGAEDDDDAEGLSGEGAGPPPNASAALGQGGRPSS